jgi:iron complex outermembrane receptor protein
MDGSGVARDGTRERYMVGPGKTFYDRIWPDATQRDLGLFVEATMAVAPRWTLRAGGRVDWVNSDAAAADEPSLMGRTVRENYVYFYGPDAADVEADETLFSGNFLVEWEPAGRTKVHLGVGLTSRAAGITERYFAFAPAPGGFQVGNPTLDPEQKYEAEVGLEFQDEGYGMYVSLFYDWFRDYILQTAIDKQDVNGDGVDDIIKGFLNVDARLYGLEAGAQFQAGDGWSFPVALAFVRGRNETSGGNLPEIPPLEARAAARYTWDGATAWWAELGGRFVDTQDKVDPTFPEDPTSGFSVYHLRGWVQLSKFFTLQAGIENLLDRDYSEHLTREAMLPVGDLKPGQEIPAPGRSFHLSIRAVF